MTPARLMGHVRDVRPHAAAVHHSALVGTVRVPAATGLPSRVVEQHGQNCTNFGYGWLVETWCRARGLTCDELSHRFAYTLGRAITTKDPLVGLSDDGAMPADVIEGMRSFGVVPESVFGGDGPEVINERPSFGALEDARTWQVDGIANIPEAGDARCAAIRRALAAQYPVGFGMQVDSEYMGWRGDAVYSRYSGKSLGGHAQRIVGARPGAFLIAGSWAQWGFVDPSTDGSVDIQGGLIWIADSVIADPDVCWDFYLVSAAPVVKEAA